nr:wat1-related protein [Ipomoea batatas]
MPTSDPPAVDGQTFQQDSGNVPRVNGVEFRWMSMKIMHLLQKIFVFAGRWDIYANRFLLLIFRIIEDGVFGISSELRGLLRHRSSQAGEIVDFTATLPHRTEQLSLGRCGGVFGLFEDKFAVILASSSLLRLMAIIVVGFRSVVYAWATRKKGPVFVAMFLPPGIVAAAIMGITFLGDDLYTGSVVGASIIALGFYTVIWGKAREVKEEGIEPIIDNNNEKVALLLPYKRDNNV